MNRQEAKGLCNHSEGYCAEPGCSQDIECALARVLGLFIESQLVPP